LSALTNRRKINFGVRELGALKPLKPKLPMRDEVALSSVELDYSFGAFTAHKCAMVEENLTKPGTVVPAADAERSTWAS